MHFQYFDQQKNSEAISFYKRATKNNPTLMSNYYHLCLALLLQGEESEAENIWLSVIEKANIEQVNLWTAELNEILKTEASKREAASDLDLAQKLRYYTNVADDLASNESWKKKKGYTFITDWFSGNIPIWEKYLSHLANKPNLNFLEIGSWEGMSACWLLDNILTHESSTITCIDTFEGEPKVEYDDKEIKYVEKSLESLEKTFDFNIAKTGTSKKVTKIVGRSQNIMRSLPLNNYNMLYVDGSHLASDVLTDAIMGWELVKVGGLIIFDDYSFTFPNESGQNTQIGIDAFLRAFDNKISVVYEADQFLVTKTSF
ncbi:class I SAM-dependent methyltransferase [Nostoc sp. 'Lobaria pulmonaria (5183) cyanobiont']|uniref:class I SAM-dependent methyltransferase n=1 Tax=Nostoc sp. 'Lobaria pulmonaria (5183) cyanobiont' TaxID=1618022 RepID=UPI000CF33A9E|nr:class I SAM-dependent methyltransferase [Nostoc sp. 'Lobaria pulmonaria (5183) cyanobiont']AVH69217.1 methyltransferase [Nostoc sp. 'Lobaria pulmonaria (5183) cyanobiont']